MTQALLSALPNNALTNCATFTKVTVGKQTIILTGTVCTLHDHPNINHLDLLKKNYQMVYCKFTVTDEDYLEVEAATNYNYATADEIEDMMKEVAQTTYRVKQEMG